MQQICSSNLVFISFIWAFLAFSSLHANAVPGSGANFKAMVLAQNPSSTTTSTTLLEVQGELKAGDSVIVDDKSLFDVHSFAGKAGQTVTINLESTEFDPYLILYGPEGNQLGDIDDFGEENINPRLSVTLPQDGDYEVIVNGYDAQSQGKYSLTIKANP